MDRKEEMIKLESRIIEQLRTIYDPEIPVSIYDLGLVYEINVDQEMNVEIIMTLTSPNCPVAESLPAEVNEKTRGIELVNQVKVELVFEPPWSMDMMTEEAKLELGFL
jgi:FeS assembly SUF system protein